MKTFLQLIRIKHWIKNLFIFAPLFFSLSLLNYILFIKSLIAFFCFSFVSVLVYILNDIKDKDSDAKHSIKILRPIASGKIKPFTALIIGITFSLIGFTTSISLELLNFLGSFTTIIIIIYLIMNIFYSFFFKHIVILDVFIIAIGFCLRVLLGAKVIDVPLSNWMIFATFSISLILGFGKRRHEIELLGKDAVNHRINLNEYSKEFLDIMIIISSTLTAISYALYTMDPTVISKFKIDTLIYSVPFVLYGLFRYLYLVYCKGKGGNPEDIVVSDTGIIITVILWIIFILIQLYLKDFIIFIVNLLKIS